LLAVLPIVITIKSRFSPGHVAPRNATKLPVQHGLFTPNTSFAGASPMPQSAMSAIAPSIPAVPDGPEDPAARALLREAVLAGPASGVKAGPALGGGFLRRLAGEHAIREALTRAGHIDVRQRDLTGPATVDAVLGLCLFSGEGYDSVLARVFPDPPTASALSQARARLDGEPLRELFDLTAPVRGENEEEEEERGPALGSTAFGLRLSAFDGTVFDVAATAENAAEFAVPAGGKRPQARLVTLIDCRTRRVRAAAAGSYAASEQELVDPLGGALGPDELNLADRNFFSMARWAAFSAAGAQLAWRVKNGKNSLPAKRIGILPDGSALVRLRESKGMLARRRAKAGDRTLARLPDKTARLVEFDVRVTDAAGKTKTSRYRILTTLLDHQAYPASQIAAVYAERWQAEIAYYRLKVTLRGAGVALRGRAPRLARQEIWGMLVVYNALCDLAAQTAVSLGVDPDQISFVAVIRRTRAHLGAANRACSNCGQHPDPDQATQALLDDIAASPRNRTGRQRTSPRTKAQRRTERTRNVTYTINIVTSNLPKAD
jgi:Insertion element 4 transposase N-terminal/Transposase DDE domain